MIYDDMLKLCKSIINNAYAPYSKLKVVAIIKCKNGEIYTGVNVENASYGLTMCAERIAVFKAVSEGNRDIEEVLIYTEYDEPIPPCGACRQVIAEFNPKAKITLASKSGVKMSVKLNELLPMPFKLKDQPYR